jgi:hypothetical protein
MFRDACGPLTDRSRVLNDADISAVETLAVFAGQPLTFRNGGDLQEALYVMTLSQHQIAGIRVQAESADVRVLDEVFVDPGPIDPLHPAQPSSYALSIYAFGPQPIDVLYRRALGLPDRDVPA